MFFMAFVCSVGKKRLIEAPGGRIFGSVCFLYSFFFVLEFKIEFLFDLEFVFILFCFFFSFCFFFFKLNSDVRLAMIFFFK